MAGYNGKIEGIDNYINGTTYNSQIIEQRKAINNTTSQGINVSSLTGEDSSGYGIARSQSDMFEGFDKAEIIKSSFNAFLKITPASSNPDFREDHNPFKFKSFNTIISETSHEKDSPSLGQGPNLKALNIDDVIKGNITVVENVKPDLEGKKGFGVFDEGDKGLTMGSYFKKRYTHDADPNNIADQDVVLGERSSKPGDLYDYTHTPEDED